MKKASLSGTQATSNNSFVPPSADFERTADLFAGYPQQHLTYLTTVRGDMEQTLARLPTFTTNFPDGQFLKLKHNLSSTLSIFGLDEGTKLFADAKVAQLANDKATFAALNDHLRNYLQLFLVQLDEEITTIK